MLEVVQSCVTDQEQQFVIVVHKTSRNTCLVLWLLLCSLDATSWVERSKPLGKHAITEFIVASGLAAADSSLQQEQHPACEATFALASRMHEQTKKQKCI